MHLVPGSHLLSMLTRARARRPKKHFYHFRGMPSRGAPPSHATNGARAREARLLPPHVRPASGYVRLCVPVDARGIRA